jgi:hypothetical protein
MLRRKVCTHRQDYTVSQPRVQQTYTVELGYNVIKGT